LPVINCDQEAFCFRGFVLLIKTKSTIMRSHSPEFRLKTVLAIFFAFAFFPAAAQLNIPFWSNIGNPVGSSDFLGTTNNMPLVFKVNNAVEMRIQPGGAFSITSLSGTGTGIVTANNTGTLAKIPLPGDSSLVLTGNGLFKPIYDMTGWYVAGNDMYNTNTGNIGIGNMIPAYKLDVSGDVRISGALMVYRIKPLPGDSAIRFGDSTIIFQGGNRMYPTAVGTIRGMGIGSYTAWGYGVNSVAIGTYVRTGTGTGPQGDYSVVIGHGLSSAPLNNTTSNSLMIGFNSDKPTFFVGPSSGAGTFGNVGIGTTSPAYSLDVSGTINGTLILQNGQPVMHWTATNGDIFYSGGSVGIGVAGNNSFNGCPTSICPSGRYLLAVGGGIRAKSLKVEPLWSDYVFDSSYVLMPLDSVSGYIQTHHHLPGVPSAAEVQANGIDVGETQALLLAKIEELTLYMIELQKQNAAMQAEIDALKKN
jgi:hypothetical protein